MVPFALRSVVLSFQDLLLLVLLNHSLILACLYRIFKRDNEYTLINDLMVNFFFTDSESFMYFNLDLVYLRVLSMRLAGNFCRIHFFIMTG